MNKAEIEFEIFNKNKNLKTNCEYYRNLNEMVNNTLVKLNLNGQKQETRNGDAICLYDQETIMLNPLARHLSLKGRTNNIFGTLGEIFWVMAGEKNISPVLEFFVPRAGLYSDDGKTWNSAYGDRLWKFKQFHHTFKMFQDDGLLTRRSTASIFIPQLDAYENYIKKNGTMKDVPCNQWLNFYVQEVNNSYYLNLKVNARSNDIIFGLGNINIPEFTIIQEMMLSVVRELYPDKDIKLGVYKHNTTNLHVYNALEKQFQNILDNLDYNTNEAIPSGDDFLEAKFPSIFNQATGETNIYIIQNFFSEIVKLFEKTIARYGVDEALKLLDRIFDKYSVERENNSLYAYSVLCLYYIIGKRVEKLEIGDFYEALKITDKKLVNGLYFAVKNNKFRNFDII